MRRQSDTWKKTLCAELGGAHLDDQDGKNQGAAYFILRASFPWLLTIVLGVCVAFTGVYIAFNCDYLADLRMGYCQNLIFADRKRCCGGVENFDETLQQCIQAEKSYVQHSPKVTWVPWEKLFGLHSRRTSSMGYGAAFLVYLLTCMAMTGITCGLVHTYAPQAKGSGIPEVKASIGGFNLPKAFQPICLIIKSVGLSLAVGAGLSLGKEGPLIHVGVCWAYLLSTMSPYYRGNERGNRALRGTIGTLLQGIPRNELAAIGAATGVSTAFGAPLGGVLFAVEELGTVRQLSKRCLILCFLGSFSSSMCLKYMNLSGANTIILFSLSQSSKNKYAKEWLAADIWIYIFLGIVGGLWGAAFVHLNCAVAKMRKKAREEGRVWLFPKCLHRLFSRSQLTGETIRTRVVVLEGVAVAAITGLANFPISRLLKFLTVDATHALLETCPNEKGALFDLCAEHAPVEGWGLVFNLVVAAVVRFFLTVITFGMSVPSGLFIPSLFIGACLGRAVGTILMMFSESHIEPGSFALVGASAMLGGFARLTVSLVVIMFELTGDITQVVPVMCACLTAKVVGDYFNESIYDEHAVLSGFAIIEDLPDHVRFHAVCSDVMEVIKDDFVIDTSSELPFVHIAKLLDVEVQRQSTLQVPTVANSVLEAMEDTPLPSTILLRKGKRRAIFGAIETEYLRQWLTRHGTVDALTFSRVSEGPLLGINTPKFPLDLVRSPKPTQIIKGGLDESSHPTAGIGRCTHGDDSSPKMTDMSHVVDTHVAKVDTNAPISIAYFIFHQNPRLKYIICLSRFSGEIGVITRQQFMDAIWNGLAYPPLNPLANFIVPRESTEQPLFDSDRVSFELEANGEKDREGEVLQSSLEIDVT